MEVLEKLIFYLHTVIMKWLEIYYEFGHVQGVSAKSGALIVSTSYSERKETEVADIETDLPRDQCFGSGDTVSLQNLS